MVKSNAVPDRKIIAFILTYNCAHMLEKAWRKIPKDYVDEIVVSDDMSKDNTIEVAKSLGLKVIQNRGKKGYGGNLKNALAYCFDHGASHAVEIHGDGAQFDPIAIKDAVPLIKKITISSLGRGFRCLDRL
jgi:glycosyltransferase involved in cell wall biosynthesis